MERILLILVFIIICLGAAGQSHLSGIVRESTTSQPVPFANVYLASTSIGTVTGVDGRFDFIVKEKGGYNLVVSSIGYTASQLHVVLKSDSSYTFDFKLQPKINELAAVIIRADTTNRKKDFREFKRFFLGETQKAFDCKIKNPTDVYVYMDETNTLIAYARAPIIIENRALGYLIHYDLLKFEVDLKTETFDISGIARVEELTPTGHSQKVRWSKNRENTYLGSVSHFMQCVITDSLLFQGWEVVIPYPGIRPSDKHLDEKIFRMKQNADLDSLKFFRNLKTLPPNSQIVSPVLSGKELLAPDDHHKMIFRGTIWIRYKKEGDDRFHVSRGVRVNLNNAQASEIYFLRHLTIYDNGYYEPQDGLHIRNYFAWIAHLAEFLPYDYRPPFHPPKK